jgi:diguanylate cyclase (GGDEF)-like protein
MSSPGRRRTDADGAGAEALRALVVDDAEHDRFFVATLLRRAGFVVTMADDGSAAHERVDREPYDLLVIDCEMPRMNGLDLVAHVRRSEHCAESFTMMLTARQDIETKLAALGAGFDDFLVKSMGEPEISAKVAAAQRLIIRQRKLDAAVRELYGLATRDELTGLFNRRFFFTEAERRLAAGGQLGVVLFDLDGFKRVNDTFGHLTGDRILRDVGALFLRSTRQEDLIARYGGDEFVMLVSGTGPVEVERLAARLGRGIDSLRWTAGDETFGVGVTSGVAVSILLQQPSLEQLLDASDRDLYKNKWLRANPDRDPSLYEYPHGHANRVADLEEFRQAREASVARDGAG